MKLFATLQSFPRAQRFEIIFCRDGFAGFFVYWSYIDKFKTIHKKPFQWIQKLFAQRTKIINIADFDCILIIVPAGCFFAFRYGYFCFFSHFFESLPTSRSKSEIYFLSCSCLYVSYSQSAFFSASLALTLPALFKTPFPKMVR